MDNNGVFEDLLDGDWKFLVFCKCNLRNPHPFFYFFVVFG